MRWRQRPPGSNWGDFGPDDQLGRANLIGPEQVRRGAQEVREGRSFCLSLPLDLPGGNALNARRHPPRLSPTRAEGRADGRPYLNFPLGHVHAGATDVLSDDQVLLSLQYSTQWDSLAHVGSLFDPEGDGRLRTVYYNGYRGHEHVLGPVDHGLPHSDADGAPGPYRPLCCEGRPADASVARALGVENLAVKGMQGRGVLVDLARVYGTQFQDIGYDQLMHAMERCGAAVEPGDMLLLRTGFAGLVLSMQGQPDPERLHHSCAALDGGDPRLLQWITDSGIAALVADNYASSSSACRWASCGTWTSWPTPCTPWAARASCSRRRRCACPAPSARRSRPSPLFERHDLLFAFLFLLLSFTQPHPETPPCPASFPCSFRCASALAPR